MTFSSSPAVFCLWICVMLAQGYVLVLLVGRKSYRQYPAFTILISFFVLRSTVILYLAHTALWLCALVKWAAYAPQLVFLVMLVMELFRAVFYPYDTLPKGTMQHFVGAVTAVAALAIVFAVLSPGAQPTAWMTFARAMDQATSWVLCAIFAFMALFSTYFGIPWRHRAYGIGIGFLLYLCVDVVVTTIVAQYGPAVFEAIWPLDMLAFLGACLIWAYYFATPEVTRPVPTPEQLNKIQAILSHLGASIGEAKREETRSATLVLPR